jgi:hypothetical protein
MIRMVVFVRSAYLAMVMSKFRIRTFSAHEATRDCKCCNKVYIKDEELEAC